MSDVKESALTQQSDCKWVRALDANGNSIRISKEDLASVVGGLMSEATTTKKELLQPLTISCYDSSNMSNDANLFYMYLNAGISAVLTSGGIINADSYGIIVHIQRSYKGTNTTSQVIMQIQIGEVANKVKIRRGKGNGSSITYSEWTEII